jgi:hypothetical protein
LYGKIRALFILTYEKINIFQRFSLDSDKYIALCRGVAGGAWGDKWWGRPGRGKLGIKIYIFNKNNLCARALKILNY